MCEAIFIYSSSHFYLGEVSEAETPISDFCGSRSLFIQDGDAEWLAETVHLLVPKIFIIFI